MKDIIRPPKKRFEHNRPAAFGAGNSRRMETDFRGARGAAWPGADCHRRVARHPGLVDGEPGLGQDIFIRVGATGKRRALPCSEVASVVRAGNCLSKTWTWVRVHDCLQGMSRWQLLPDPSAQQQGFPVSDEVAAQAGGGADIPKANTAMRMATKVLKCTTTSQPLQYPRFYFKL